MSTAAPLVAIPFDNSYARLGGSFSARMQPVTVRAPQLIRVNDVLARFLNIDPESLHSQEAAEIFAGNRVADGSEPLAMAYAGHQFANFVPQLGDGRACLLGEVIAQDGRRYDIQLKGSGPTPFSRRGDGRAALGPVLREYLVSEAMHALGVPTTRALAAVLTGEQVVREEMMPGAVFTRVASSHLRVGTFEYFAAREDKDSIRTLADYAIQRHYPEAAQSDKRYRALLQGVTTRQAKLVAQWMGLGFIHGVMNTDNTSISGETIDYGPCAFMEAYDPATVFSAIDRNGRYAYGNQPGIMTWNLSRLAETLLPLMEDEEGSKEAALAAAYDVLNSFAPTYEAEYLAIFRRKLGLTKPQDGDVTLIKDLLEAMTVNRADFILTFRRLSEGDGSFARTQFADPAAFDAWAAGWRDRLRSEASSQDERNAAMQRENPIYIPRNHLVQEIIEAAVLQQDFAPFEQLLEVLATPFEERAGLERFAMPALPEQRVTQTFCGT
ncbi:MAG: protein adenylyltransferase SelO [Janthinobacterium lividum]